MTGNLHLNSDIGYICVSRSDDGRGIKQIRTLYKNIAPRKHLLQINYRGSLIQYIVNSEEQGFIRLGKELLGL